MMRSTLFIVDLINESKCPYSINLAFSKSLEADEYRLGDSFGDYDACKCRLNRALLI